jgi:two-component system LytT family response regulator
VSAEALRVLVADDEAMARRRLVRLLAAMDDVQLAGECATGDEVLDRVRAGGVDLILLDIEMPGLSGLDALSLLPPDGPTVVFCTAHAAHAVAAFDVGAIDYLLKPVDAARLRKALDRGRRRGPPPASPSPPLARLPIDTREGIVLLDPQEITHALLDGELVTVHTARARYFCASSLQDLEARLPAETFVRVHRRALLNLAHVARLEACETGGFIARTSAGQPVDVSRQAARELRRRLGLR